MKNLKQKTKQLKHDIVDKFGSLRRLAKATERDEMELLQDLTINLTEASYKRVLKLYESTDSNNPIPMITDKLREELNKKVLDHPDAKNKKLRASYREFFVKNPTWTNTYFSEVMNGTRLKVTNKLQLLCIKLDIEFRDFI